MSQQARPITLAVPLNQTDHIRGSESAKVTVIEYGDFECPFEELQRAIEAELGAAPDRKLPR